jgi:cell division protein FtsL
VTRVNLVFLAAVLLCALATVTSTHRARLLFVDLENEQTRQKQIELEWNQLQLEQSTWAKHALVESIAVRQLGMHTPDSRRLIFVAPGPAGAQGIPSPEAAGAR